MKIDNTIKYILTSEYLFTLLPIVILVIVKCYQCQYSGIFYNTGWSITSIILFGKSVVKFSAGISNSNKEIRWQLVALIITLIIIFGLIPSVIILVLNLTSDINSFGTYLIQLILFILSSINFFIIGIIGQKLLIE